METTAAHRLGPVLAVSGNAHLKMRLGLKLRTNLSLVQQVLTYDLDGVYVCGPIRHPDLSAMSAVEEKLVVATAPIKAFDSAFKPNCRLLVKSAGRAQRECFEALLAKRGINGVSSLEFGTLHVMIV